MNQDMNRLKSCMADHAVVATQGVFDGAVDYAAPFIARIAEVEREVEKLRNEAASKSVKYFDVKSDGWVDK